MTETKMKLDLDALFELLITARNSKDEEALQEAIDIVATASCAKLPCDVVVAPATVIRKGCGLTTLLLSIEQRSRWGIDVGDVTGAAKAQIRPV